VTLRAQPWPLVVSAAATAILLLDVTVVYVALPSVGGDLDASFTDLQWVVDAYALAVAAALLAFGSLADRAGRLRVFLLGLLAFALASAVCAVAWTSVVLVLARAAQGIGAAAMFSTSLALIAAAYEGRARAVALGAWGAISGASLAVGPVIGGLVIDGAGWRWVFAMNLPLAALIWLAARRGVPESRDENAGPTDIAGTLLWSAALALLVTGLLRGGEDGWGSAPIVGALAGAGALLAAFAAVELRCDTPLLDLRLFRGAAFSGTVAVAFLQSVAIYPVLLFLAIHFQVTLGYDALEAGLRVLPITLALFAVAPLGGRLTGRLPLRMLLGAGLLGVAAGLLLVRAADPAESWTAMLPGFLVLGAGTGVLSPALASAMIEALPAARAGFASGVGNTFRQAGIAAGVAILGAVFRSEPTMDAGLDAVLLVAALTAVAGALAALAIPASRTGATDATAASAPV
jgi:EmrB/QacA subfamily drug resistance transporter